MIEDYVFLDRGASRRTTKTLPRLAGAASSPRATPSVGLSGRGGSVLLPGVTVGREAVVAAGSLVSRDVPDRTIDAGNPLRLWFDPGQQPVIRSF